MNKKQNNASFDINYPLEFYHRRWNGGGVHMLSNKIGGAFGPTKKEWNRMIETRNRINKQRKQKSKAIK